MATEQRLMTAGELLELPDDGKRYELIRGGVRTMSPAGEDHGVVGANAVTSLKLHVRANRLGRVYTAETGFLLARNPDTVRAPDAAFVSRQRLGTGERITGYRSGAPDLVVEVISPHDRYTEVADKVAEWLAHGAWMVVLANPRDRSVLVHRPGAPTRELHG